MSEESKYTGDQGFNMGSMMMPLMGVVMIAAITPALLSILPSNASANTGGGGTSPSEVFTCPYDGEQFSTLADLYAHMTSAHPDKIIHISWE